MRVSTMPDMANRMFMMGPPAFAQVKPDLTFELSGLFGPLTVQVGNPPRGWIAKSIRFKGEDIIDTLYDFTNARASDPMEIVLTNQGRPISGRVTNDRGEAASEVMVLLIPADPARRRTVSIPWDLAACLRNRTAAIRSDRCAPGSTSSQQSRWKITRV